MLYCPKHFVETRVPVLHELINKHSFGIWTCWAERQLVVNHIPFYLDPDAGEFGMLKGHVARANSIWKLVQPDTPSVVVFQGPHRYISPSWYASKKEHGKVVPTWNYMVVHAHGQPTAMDDKAWLHSHLTSLTDKQEAEQDNPWKVTDAPDDYIDTMMNGIVGIEMPLSSLDGKWKLGQNKPDADRASVLDSLGNSTLSGDAEMADFLKSR